MPSLDEHFGALGGVAPPDEWPELGERGPRQSTGSIGIARRLAVAALALAVAAGGLVLAVRAFHADRRPRQPAGSVGNGLIAFSRGGPDAGLYAMNADGTAVTRLTSDPSDTGAAWSPDGSRIAFVRFDDDARSLFLMDADGTHLSRITGPPPLVDPSDEAPAWSPDGATIAFGRGGREPGDETGDEDIYTMSPDGTNVLRLTHAPLIESEPSWSPDGSRIAFVGYDLAAGGKPPSPVRLYVMRANGAGVTQVGPQDVDAPAWSPDGSEIAFVDTESGAIVTVSPDGSGERRILDVAELVGGVHLVYDLTWSPDGTKLAFAAGPDDTDTHIYVVNRDGTGVRRLTDDPAPDASPTWQPVPLGG
jgi:Tol biopolymer transport system component